MEDKLNVVNTAELEYSLRGDDSEGLFKLFV